MRLCVGHSSLASQTLSVSQRRSLSVCILKAIGAAGTERVWLARLRPFQQVRNQGHCFLRPNGIVAQWCQLFRAFMDGKRIFLVLPNQKLSESCC